MCAPRQGEKRRGVAPARRLEVIASRSELLSLHCPRHPHLLWRLGYSVSRLYVVFTINFITFPHVPLTFLHVPPWLSKRFVDISYVPIRSEQPSRSFRKKMYSKHTFLYVLCNPPTNSKKVVLKSYVPIRSEQPSRSSCLISYVPTRSGYAPSRSTNDFEKK